MWKSYKEGSRANWGVETDNDNPLNIEQIQTGAILRIADATEAMAKRHIELLDDKAMYEKWYINEVKKHQMTANTLRVTKGHLTRAKKRIAELELKLSQKEVLTLSELDSERAAQEKAIKDHISEP